MVHPQSHERSTSFSKLLHSLQKLLYLVIILILDFSEESDVFDKSGFDMFIIHELAKNVKLFPQELVSEVYLEDKKQKTSQIKKVSKVTNTSNTLFFTRCLRNF